MSDPIHLLNTKVINNGNMAGNLISNSINIKDAVRLCFQASWSGTSPVGSLQVQGSNDGIIFSNDPDSSSVAVSGNNGNVLIKIENPSYAYVQIIYTSTSGIGTLQTSLNAKRD